MVSRVCWNTSRVMQMVSQSSGGCSHVLTHPYRNLVRSSKSVCHDVASPLSVFFVFCVGLSGVCPFISTPPHKDQQPCVSSQRWLAEPQQTQQISSSKSHRLAFLDPSRSQTQGQSRCLLRRCCCGCLVLSGFFVCLGSAESFFLYRSELSVGRSVRERRHVAFWVIRPH